MSPSGENGRHAAKYIRKRMFLVKPGEKAVCVSDDPGCKNCWQGTWVPRRAIFDGAYSFIDRETGEIEFMVKKSFANKQGWA